MAESISLGPVPYEEACQQVGTKSYDAMDYAGNGALFAAHANAPGDDAGMQDGELAGVLAAVAAAATGKPQENRVADDKALVFMLAGNARVTLRSLKSGVRFTYKVRKAEGRAQTWFVSLLNGADNENNYVYLGMITGLKFKRTAASKVSSDRDSFKGFAWLMHQLGNMLPLNNAELWHSGQCGRCGRLLTVPESIASGFGPECITKVGF